MNWRKRKKKSPYQIFEGPVTYYHTTKNVQRQATVSSLFLDRFLSPDPEGISCGLTTMHCVLFSILCVPSVRRLSLGPATMRRKAWPIARSTTIRWAPSSHCSVAWMCVFSGLMCIHLQMPQSLCPILSLQMFQNDITEVVIVSLAQR